MNNTEKPWLSNPTWAKGRISNSPSGAKIVWFFAIVWNALSAPALIKGIPEMLKSEKYLKVAVMAIFPFIGFIILCVAVYFTLRLVKYNKSILEMKRMPGVIGGPFRAQFLLPAKLAIAECITVQLSNLHQFSSGSGKNRRTVVNTLWQHRRVYYPDEWKVQNGYVVLPVDFSISYDTKSHDKSDPKDCTYWNLDAYAEMPGIDFTTSFEVPVFKTEESDPEVKGPSDNEERILERPPKIKGITCQELNNGIRIFVHPFKFFSTAIIQFTFSIILFIVCAILYWKGVFIPLAFLLLFAVFLLIFSIHFFLIQTEIVFYEKFGQIKSTWLGLGFVREFNLDDIEDIRVKTTGPAQGDANKSQKIFTLEFIPKSGDAFSLSDMTNNYEQALWMSAKLKERITDLNQS